MSISRWARGRRAVLAAVAGAGMVAATLSTAGSATAAPPALADDRLEAGAAAVFKDGTYVVVMKDRPIVGYAGGIKGYAATKPAPGEKVNPSSAAAQRYRGLLKQKQDRALKAAGNPPVTHRYTTAVSGFSARLTSEQAERLAKDPAVLSVSPNEMLQPDTNTSPDLLGLQGPGGVWDQLGGVSNLRRGAGTGIVVGVIDTGIRPENPSFADNGMRAPAKWFGACDTGEAEDFSCSNKLIGARYFVEGFGEDRLADHESVSPLDMDGHGTHTAGTAAGNAGVEATVGDRSFGTISGMAPAAHVAAYKVCWDSNTGGGCATNDSVAAIDQAVADGVDVLNFSISGTSSDYLAPVELAFMFAADAGIFVAASSGNSGPGASTTNHPSPWLTTVAASTHVIYEKTLVTAGGQRFIGASITEALPAQTPMVLSEEIPAEGVSAEDAALCLPGTLDGELAEGMLVVCDRGVNARVEKSDTVAKAGGAGMVLVNVTPGSLDNDLHAIPTVHLSHTERDAVRGYVNGGGQPTGAIEDTNEGSTTEVPEVAGFSSRGPSLGAGGDILKPDISAPGVGVLAAYSPRSAGRDFDFLSGTSMSSPHIAGLAALVKQANPRWSPMAVKSAMMTTATDHASDASSEVFASGAGFVNPRRFLNPGLVYDSDQGDWWDFLAGQGVQWSDGTPVSTNPIDASDLNQASIAIGAMAGKQTVTRTVTNVAPAGRGGAATFTAEVSGLPGIQATVSPSTLRLRPGQSATFTVSFATDGATLGEYSKGYLTWSGPTGEVRSPIAVKPVAAAVPASVSVPVDASSFEVAVTPGYSGALQPAVLGLAKGEVTEATAQNTGGADFDAGDTRNWKRDFTVPEGSFATRIELQASNPDADDLDLFITRKGETTPGWGSATGAANEVTTAALEPGEYTVHVQAWALADAAEATTFTVRSFDVPAGPTGTLAFDPPSQAVTTGEPVTFTGNLSTDGVSPYFGIVGYLSEAGQVGGLTFVSVG